jgi:hypothetical protein
MLRLILVAFGALVPSLGLAPPGWAIMVDAIGRGIDCTADPIGLEETLGLGGHAVREYRIIGACNGVLGDDLQRVSFYIQGYVRWDGGTSEAREVLQAVGQLRAIVWTRSTCPAQDPFIQGGDKTQIRSGCSKKQVGYDLSGTPAPPDLRQALEAGAPLLVGFTTLAEAMAVKTQEPLMLKSVSKAVAAGAGQVAIETPSENQAIAVGGALIVRFKPANPVFPPDGTVKVEIQRLIQTPGNPLKNWATQGGPYFVDAYTQALSRTMSTAGQYRLRATSIPNRWTAWRHFKVIQFLPPSAGKTQGLPGSGQSQGTGQSKKSQPSGGQ